jgi:hypothetical protein
MHVKPIVRYRKKILFSISMILTFEINYRLLFEHLLIMVLIVMLKINIGKLHCIFVHYHRMLHQQVLLLIMLQMLIRQMNMD